MKFNAVFSTMIVIGLGVLLLSNGVSAWIAAVWMLIISCQAVTWYWQGKTIAYQQTSDHLRVIQTKAGVWN